MNKLDDDSVLVIPSIADKVMPEFEQDRRMMSAIQADMDSCKDLLRDAFLGNSWIETHDDSSSEESIRVVDGSSATITSGEFSTLLALAVNVSTGTETPLQAQYHHVCAPNSESFGMLASPVMAAAEALALAPMNRCGYTLYDGSLQGLNMNLGNLFRTQSDSNFLGEITEYTDKLESLFKEVVDPACLPKGDDFIGKTVYSSIFNKERQDLFAISKKSTSTYTFHRLKELPAIREALGGKWFAYPKSDRLLLSQILKAGEYIKPKPFKDVELKSGSKNLLGLSDVAKKGRGRECNEEEYKKFALNFYFLFFKPAPHSPVIRVEIVSSREGLNQKVQDLLKILTYQCSTPGLIEPYGLWLADKLAKQVHPFKQIYGSANAIAFPELFRPNRTEEINK